MKKSVFRNLYLLLLVCFVSCASVQTIYTISADYGQLFFVRPTKVTKLPKDVKNCEFDITVRNLTETGTIDTPVVNYSVVFDKNHYNTYPEVSFYFMLGNKKIEPQNKEIIFKEIGNNKNLTVRYTSTIPAEDFLEMVKNPQDIQIGVSSPAEEIILPNKEFSQKIIELGVVL